MSLLLKRDEKSGRLQLVNSADPKMKPLQLDLSQYDQEMTLGQGGRRLLLNAVMGKAARTERVLDATAGLLRDAFFMAKFGLSVTCIESEPLLIALIEDALAQKNTPCRERLHLIAGNALEVIPSLPPFEVIYLDPMFREAGVKAKVKKDLQLLQLLTHDQPDENLALLELACTYAKKKVIVKRARSAPPLGSRQPCRVILGKSIRFDVYFSQGGQQIT